MAEKHVRSRARRYSRRVHRLTTGDHDGREAGTQPQATFSQVPFSQFLAIVGEAEPERRCRICGCTDERACPGGCYWVPDPEELGDLCSDCAGEIELEAGGA